MAISYNKLWKLLIDKNMMRTEMACKAGITGNVLGRLAKISLFPWEVWKKYANYFNVVLVM